MLTDCGCKCNCYSFHSAVFSRWLSIICFWYEEIADFNVIFRLRLYTYGSCLNVWIDRMALWGKKTRLDIKKWLFRSWYAFWKKNLYQNINIKGCKTQMIQRRIDESCKKNEINDIPPTSLKRKDNNSTLPCILDNHDLAESIQRFFGGESKICTGKETNKTTVRQMGEVNRKHSPSNVWKLSCNGVWFGLLSTPDQIQTARCT